jgi:hypothetical protein
MQKGHIVAAGTPLRLKSKYGKGYRLTLTSAGEPLATKPPVESAVLESSAADQIIWRIEDAGDLSDVVLWADKKEHETGLIRGSESANIQAWGISMPSLEDVLLEKKLF